MARRTSVLTGQSLLSLLGLPQEFGTTILLLCLVLTIAPYVAGADFGIIKVPGFPSIVARRLKVLGPIVFALAISAHIRIWPGSSPTALELSTPFGNRELLLDGARIKITSEEFSLKTSPHTFQSLDERFRLDIPNRKMFQFEMISLVEYVAKVPEEVEFLHDSPRAKFFNSAFKKRAYDGPFKNARVFRAYNPDPVHLKGDANSHIGQRISEVNWRSLVNNDPSAVELLELYKTMSTRATLFNELVIVIIDKKEMESEFAKMNYPRLVQFNPLTFLIATGRLIPATDIHFIKEIAVTGAGSVLALYGQMDFHNVHVNGSFHKIAYLDFYRLYTTNDKYIYQIGINYIPLPGQPRQTWDELVRMLTTLRILTR